DRRRHSAGLLAGAAERCRTRRDDRWWSGAGWRVAELGAAAYGIAARLRAASARSAAGAAACGCAEPWRAEHQYAVAFRSRSQSAGRPTRGGQAHAAKCAAGVDADVRAKRLPDVARRSGLQEIPA